MVNISRCFLASAQIICNQCTNRDVVFEAIKRTFTSSMEYKPSIYVKELFQQLKKDGIGTAMVESLSKKLCDMLPKHRQRTLVRIITNWKLQDAHKELRKQKHTNTETWRRERVVIKEANALEEYQRLWRREITKYEHKLREMTRMKRNFDIYEANTDERGQ